MAEIRLANYQALWLLWALPVLAGVFAYSFYRKRRALAALEVAVLSAHGLTCSIEGNPSWHNVGYHTDDARKLALNVILYAVTGGK